MTETNQSVGFIGLGNMGSAMAKNLAQAGFRLRVWNRNPQKAKEMVRDLPQAQLCNTPREAAEGSQFVVSSLANDEAVRAVTFGPKSSSPLTPRRNGASWRRLCLGGLMPPRNGNCGSSRVDPPTHWNAVRRCLPQLGKAPSASPGPRTRT